jgi:hypothetical protein
VYSPLTEAASGNENRNHFAVAVKESTSVFLLTGLTCASLDGNQSSTSERDFKHKNPVTSPSSDLRGPSLRRPCTTPVAPRRARKGWCHCLPSQSPPKREEEMDGMVWLPEFMCSVPCSTEPRDELPASLNRAQASTQLIRCCGGTVQRKSQRAVRSQGG